MYAFSSSTNPINNIYTFLQICIIVDLLMFIHRSDCFTSYSHKCLIINHCVLKAASIYVYIQLQIGWWSTNRPSICLSIFIVFICLSIIGVNTPFSMPVNLTKPEEEKPLLVYIPKPTKNQTIQTVIFIPPTPPPSKSYSDFIKINLLSINPNKNEECDEREHVKERWPETDTLFTRNHQFNSIRATSRTSKRCRSFRKIVSISISSHRNCAEGHLNCQTIQ